MAPAETAVDVYDPTGELEAASDDAIRNAIASLSRGELDTDLYSTFEGSDDETGEAIHFALSESIPAKENTGKEIDVVGIIIMRVELADEASGELKSQPRIVFVDKDDTAYHVTSPVVFRDVKTLFKLRGKPSPERPVRVKFEMGGTGNRRFVTLKPVRTVKTKK